MTGMSISTLHHPERCILASQRTFNIGGEAREGGTTGAQGFIEPFKNMDGIISGTRCCMKNSPTKMPVERRLS